MTNKIQNEVNVVSGMTVSNVQRAGTEAQAKAIKLFDWNNDGVLSKKEANCFNSFQVELTQNPLKENTYQISLFNKESLGENKRPEGIHIDYSNEEDLNSLSVKDGELVFDNNYVTYDKYEQISYNASEKTLLVDGLEKGTLFVKDAKTLDVHNSDVVDILVDRVDNLTITNTSDKFCGFKTATDIYVNKDHDTNINVDNNSNVDVKRIDFKD